MGSFDVKNEDKDPSDANKRGKGFGSGNTVRREYFAGTSEALNALQVKFYCGEGNEGGVIIGMSTTDDGIPEHKARGRRRRQDVN